MRTFDFAPLSRSTIGFDRLFDLFDESLRHTPDEGYPPYNIERTGDDAYRITLALAGFGADDVTVTAEQNTLTVEGRKLGQGQREYVYQGIAARPFRRLFNLADYVEVKQASFQDGLVREIPEAMKPRKITINGASKHQIESKKAA